MIYKLSCPSISLFYPLDSSHGIVFRSRIIVPILPCLACCASMILMDLVSMVEKSSNNLKAHFTIAHKTYCLKKNTAIGAGYNVAIAATTELQQDTVEAIANLANAAATGKRYD
jgi:hypothetical protein